MRIGRTFLVALALTATLAVTAVQADDDRDERMRLDGGPSESIGRVTLTAAEIRQARALEQARQRVARLEAHAWAGRDPARPNIAANPYTQLRYRVYTPNYWIWPAWAFAPVR